MPRERRTRRSEEKLVALRYQLDATASHVLGARALFLADPDGLLLSQAASGIDSEAIAAYAPLLYRLAQDPEAQMGLLGPLESLRGRSLHVRPVQVGGEPFTLGIVSDELLSPGELDELRQAARGVQRILN